MQITIDTANLSKLDYQILALLGGVATSPAAEAEEATKPAKKAAAKKPEPEPVVEAPEAIAEEPVPEEPEADEPDDADDMADEDLLALAVKKATEMVGSGDAAKVREALDAAGASRVRELNVDNVREFFKALG